MNVGYASVRQMRDVHAVEESFVAGIPLPQVNASLAAEYDSYATHIVSLVREAPDATQLARHIGKLQLESMRVDETPTNNLDIAREIVKALADAGDASPS